MKRGMVFPATLFVSVVLHAGLFVAPWTERGDNGFQDRYEILFESTGGGYAPERVRQRPVKREPVPVAREAVPDETTQNEATNEAEPVLSSQQENADDGQRKHSEDSRRSGEGEASRLDEYLVRVKAAVEYNKFYPLFAKQLRQVGTSVVRVSIRPDGSVSGLSIVSSSGHQSLDRAAEKAVRSSAPFDPPARFGLSELTLDIPVTYKLN